MQKRFKLLGVKLNTSLTSYAKASLDMFSGVHNYRELVTHAKRRNDIRRMVDLVVLTHLGVEVGKPTTKCIDDGLDVAVEMFCTDWWHEGTKDDKAMMDKSRKRRDLHWLDVFSNSLFLGTLSKRWDDVAQICNWVDGRMKPEYSAGFIEDELGFVYLSIASGLRGIPVDGLEKLEAKVDKCRIMRPKLLLNLWRAARHGDQSLFLKCFTVALEHYLDSYKGGASLDD